MMECEQLSSLEFARCLTLIVEGSPEEIQQGWTNLRQLDEEIRENDLSDVMDDIRKIVGRSTKNVHEVPKLMVYFSTRLKENPFEVNSSANNYTLFLKNTADNDIQLLADIIEILIEYLNVYLPTCNSQMKFCEATIYCLSSFQMPTNKDSIVIFLDSSTRIFDSLNEISKKAKDTDKRNLIVKCLETLYKIISDTERNSLPGVALVGVLRLVESSSIEDAVRWIISNSNSDENLEQALRTLGVWLSQLLKEPSLNFWITSFVQGLEKVQKYSVLNRFTDEFLRKMIQCLRLPMGRPFIIAVIYLMMKGQSTPNLFHKVIRDIEDTLTCLRKETSESSIKSAQSLIDCTKALMLRFPGYSIYDSLEKCFHLPTRTEVVDKILQGPQWIEGIDVEGNSINSQNICYMNSGKVGLTNLGNTCYMNSVLQALAMTKQFRQEVFNFKPPVDTNANIILRKLQNLFALLLYSKRIALSPTEVLQASRPAYFTPGQQQDSSEFLCHLLDVLYEQEKSHPPQADDLMKILKSKPEDQIEEVEEMNLDTESCVIKRWITEEDLTEGTTLERKTQSLADFTEGDDLGQTPQLSDSHSDSTDSGIQSVGGEESLPSNLVHRVFGGESKITYQCAQCDTSSHNTDKFRDLQLCFPEEILENQEVSVQDLINYYLTPEKLTGDNKYRCDKCMKLCDAQRIIKILRAPSHLILTLKHFHYDSESRLRTKLRHKVTYNETIQLPVSTQACTGFETYQLYAAVVHCGYSMDYGHYFTYARDSKQVWYKFNDSYVSKTTLYDFKSLEPPDTPYILFYEKITKTDGVDDEDKPDISSLSQHLQDLIAKDTVAYYDELRQQAEKKKNQRERKFFSLRQDDNFDDENPPSSNFFAPLDSSANHYLL